MIRTMFWVLALLNGALLAWLLWGGTLTQDGVALQPPLNPDKIKLLGFSPAAVSAPVAASAPSAASSPAVSHTVAASAPASAPVVAATSAVQPQAACMQWGEFSGADLAHANEKLAGLNLGASLARREVEHSIGYWVYIPPPKKHADVNERIAQLKHLGIKEFFVVQEKGKWQDAISLNVFKTEEMAKKFQEHLKSRGVKGAVVGERQTRLKFTVFLLKNPSQATLARLAEWQKDFSGIELKQVTCK